LKDRAREQHRKLLDQHLLKAPFASLPLSSITSDDVRNWYTRLDAKTPTLRAHCYGLLRTIMATALSDGKIKVTPCIIRGAGTAKRVKEIRPATLDELEIITAAMPDQYQAMILLASWCALRFGELTELRRKDVDLADKVIRVRRAVVLTTEGFKQTSPKSDAGIPDVAIPPHLLPVLEDHLAKHVGKERDALLFGAKRGGYLAEGTLFRHFRKAREAAERPDLRFHDLRHSGAVLAAHTGATLAELMARLGHSSPAAAMRYQHAAQGRDREIAALLSKLAANR
jgi:integrase